MERWYEHVGLEEAKVFIRANLSNAARSFLAIGYYLKQIRDNELFREEGHDSIWAFAQAEYGLSKSTASRYMSMNDRFSMGGNSPVVDSRYKDFEKSKLQEMLSLTDEQLTQVTPEMRVQEIREIRKCREIPYIPLEGQLDLTRDFPEVIPLPAASQELEEVLSAPQVFTMEVSDFAEDEGYVAISQQEAAPASVLGELPLRTPRESYHVKVPVVGYYYIEVEAESEEEAVCAAMKWEEIPLLKAEEWEICREVQAGDKKYQIQAERVQLE